MATFGEEKFEAFVYLDHHNVPAIWNIVRGGYNTPDCLPPEEGAFVISLAVASMLSNSEDGAISANRLISELYLDGIRHRYYPGNVSRLRGVFVFDSIESMSELWETNRWGGHFSDEYIADIGVYAKKSSRVDSNWIAHVFKHDGTLQPDWETAAHNYWSGEAYPNKTPIWERIVEGTITIWSMQPKLDAFKEIEAIWPNSLGLLSHCVNCFTYGSLDGQSYPRMDIKPDHIEINYYLRLVDSLNSEFIARLADFLDKHPEQRCLMPSLGMNTPDLQNFSIKLYPDDTTNLKGIIQSLISMAQSQP